MNKLFLFAGAAISLVAIDSVSATSLLAQSNLEGQTPRAAADVNMDAVAPLIFAGAAISLLALGRAYSCVIPYSENYLLNGPTYRTPDGVRKVQLALQKKGITPGPIDGKL